MQSEEWVHIILRCYCRDDACCEGWDILAHVIHTISKRQCFHPGNITGRQIHRTGKYTSFERRTSGRMEAEEEDWWKTWNRVHSPQRFHSETEQNCQGKTFLRSTIGSLKSSFWRILTILAMSVWWSGLMIKKNYCILSTELRICTHVNIRIKRAVLQKRKFWESEPQGKNKPFSWALWSEISFLFQIISCSKSQTVILNCRFGPVAKAGFTHHPSSLSSTPKRHLGWEVMCKLSFTTRRARLASTFYKLKFEIRSWKSKIIRNTLQILFNDECGKWK